MENRLIDYIYDKSVDILFFLSHHLGLSYRQVNVVVFTIIEPILYVILILWILKLKQIIKTTKIH